VVCGFAQRRPRVGLQVAKATGVEPEDAKEGMRTRTSESNDGDMSELDSAISSCYAWTGTMHHW